MGELGLQRGNEGKRRREKAEEHDMNETEDEDISVQCDEMNDLYRYELWIWIDGSWFGNSGASRLNSSALGLGVGGFVNYGGVRAWSSGYERDGRF